MHLTFALSDNSGSSGRTLLVVLIAITAVRYAHTVPTTTVHLQAISSSSLSRNASSFSLALELMNFMLTRGGNAKSTSR